jgi:hypothetical protein
MLPSFCPNLRLSLCQRQPVRKVPATMGNAWETITTTTELYLPRIRMPGTHCHQISIRATLIEIAMSP